MGRIVQDRADGLNLYKAHSRAVGFSVRINTSRKNKVTGAITDFYFCCSKEGNTDTKRQKKRQVQFEEIKFEENENKKKRKERCVNETRTGCRANIRFKITDTGEYRVIQHHTEHNHTLVNASKTHHLKAERHVKDEIGKVIEKMIESGIKPMDVYAFLSNEAGSEESLGLTKRDLLNYVGKYKSQKIEGGDMQTVLDALQERAESDSSFFYRLKFGEGDQIVSYFWRDSMMLEDYKAFGDVVIFDTTYRTNKYGLICAPIIGVNNHWKTTMFGCAFVIDETTSTFEWVLQTFLKSMKGLQPKTIFTDQDLAMSNAIENVFPETRHILCLWHLQKKFISRFGQLKSNEEFKNMFDRCLYGCDEEIEFENLWNEIIQKYGLEDKEWFDRLYNLRTKWCPVFSKDIFSAGILSSQRSEVTNKAISFKANKQTSLFEFFNIFEDTVKRWRSNEKADNYKNKVEKPKTKSKLLKQAAEIYTLNLYKDFEEEYDTSMKSYIRDVSNEMTSTGMKMFEVSLHEEFKRSQRVIYHDGLKEFACSCFCFNETGIICYYILRVMHMHNVFTIPKAYIRKRWTKSAKSSIWEDRQGHVEDREEEDSVLDTPWRHTIAKKIYNLVCICQSNDDAKKVCDDALENMYKSVKKVFQTDEEKMKEINDEQERSKAITDPLRPKTKGRPRGRNKRLRGQFERRKTATRHPNEFGTKTPNPQLI